MKKIITTLITAALLVCTLSTAALADGIYDLTETDDDSVSALIAKTDEDAEVTPETVQIGDNTVDVYTGTEKVEITLSGTITGKNYMIFVFDDGYTVPVEGHIRYIDQITAAGSSVTFDAYPDKLEDGKIYGIFISSNAESGALKKVAEFKYYQEYVLGDVYEDGKILANDAQMILNAVVHNITLTERQEKAADVYKDGKILANDAQKILNYIVHNIEGL